MMAAIVMDSFVFLCHCCPVSVLESVWLYDKDKKNCYLFQSTLLSFVILGINQNYSVLGRSRSTIINYNLY